ncbi:MAG: hypothetical protein ACR2HH_16780 [Chthoniobacterales bacterium]
MENIFFLVLVAVVGLIRVLYQVAEKNKNAEAQKRAGTQSRNLPPPRAPAASEEERVRKFFEALGVPVSGAAPSQTRREIQPRSERAKRKPIMPVDPFPSPRGANPRPPSPVAIPEPNPSQLVTITPEPAIRRAASADRSAPVFEVHDLQATDSPDFARAMPAPTIATLDPSAPSLVERLAAHDGLRDAVLLREVFGPPRGLQPLH